MTVFHLPVTKLGLREPGFRGIGTDVTSSEFARRRSGVYINRTGRVVIFV